MATWSDKIIVEDGKIYKYWIQTNVRLTPEQLKTINKVEYNIYSDKNASIGHITNIRYYKDTLYDVDSIAYSKEGVQDYILYCEWKGDTIVPYPAGGGYNYD